MALFASAAAVRDCDAIAELFVPDAYWRDVLAFDWDLGWDHTAKRIGPGLVEALLARQVTGLRIDTEAAVTFRDDEEGGWIEAFLLFETDIGRCRGHLRLRPPSPGRRGWRAWTLLTALLEIRGHPEAVGHHRPSGLLEAGEDWSAKRRTQAAYLDREPQVVVVGAGHAGLGVAARLDRLGVDTLVLERSPVVGDNWRNRYRSLYLHNEVWMNHLPYLPFPDTWPLFTSKDKLADWLEGYAKALDLNVWTGAECLAAAYDDAEGRWNLDVRLPAGERHVVRPRHVVLATGVFGKPQELELQGVEDFNGQVVRSQDYKENGDVRGKKVLVIGTGSSAHDIAHDCYLGGADVTMLQRSTTCVISVSPGAGMVYARYREGAGPLDDLDLAGLSMPIPLVAQMQRATSRRIAQADAALLQGLEEAGFRTDFGEDGGGMLMKYYRSGGGYYINVGTSQLIIDGRIKVKQGVEVDRLRPNEVVFTDGSVLPVDMVVVAVGFGNMQETIGDLFGDDVAQRVGPVWGIGEDGELRAMWRPTGQVGLWITGGSFTQSRSLSLVLALQILARELGLVTP